MLVILVQFLWLTIINSDSSFTETKLEEASSPLLLSTSASYFGAKLKFPVLKAPSYNVTVPLGSTARLPCTVTNVEHQAVSIRDM